MSGAEKMCVRCSHEPFSLSGLYSKVKVLSRNLFPVAGSKSSLIRLASESRAYYASLGSAQRIGKCTNAVEAVPFCSAA